MTAHASSKELQTFLASSYAGVQDFTATKREGKTEIHGRAKRLKRLLSKRSVTALLMFANQHLDEPKLLGITEFLDNTGPVRSV